MFDLFKIFNKKSEPLNFTFKEGEILPQLDKGHVYGTAFHTKANHVPFKIEVQIMSANKSSEPTLAHTLIFKESSADYLEKILAELKKKEIKIVTSNMRYSNYEVMRRRSHCVQCDEKVKLVW